MADNNTNQTENQTATAPVVTTPPTAEQPATPVVEQPTAPVVTTPPAVEQPAAPKVEQPAAPVVTTPTAAEQPAAPVETPTTTGEQPGAESSENPAPSQEENENSNATKEDEFLWPENGYNGAEDVIKYIEERIQALGKKSEKDLKREKRWRRFEGIISSLSDTARAVANLIGTTQYAPNMYDHAHSLTPAMKARFDKIDAQRKADDEEYYNLAMKLFTTRKEEEEKNFQRGKENLLYKLKFNEDKRKDNEDRRRAAAAEHKLLIEDLQVKLMNHQITIAQVEALMKQAEGKNAEQIADIRLQAAKLGLEKAQSEIYKNYHTGSGGGGKGGSSGGGGGKTQYHHQDKSYSNQKEWGAAVIADANKKGIPLYEGYGKNKKKKSHEQLKAECDAKGGTYGHIHNPNKKK